MPERPFSNRDVYSVSRLNREARTLLESALPPLWVQGELSNLSRPGSGHWYFSLKDRDAQVRCAMFRQRNLLTRFSPKDGQLVLAYGRISLYEPRGEYQLLCEYLEEAGEGALKRAFEVLKARLAAAGLFASERKRPLPLAPRRVGVITSPTGAALRDILHILRRRFPAAQVLIYPVPVQGAAAAPAIAAALDLASARAECEVLILARGGGSLEDLWAFNDERVALALQRCAIPVISGIGHETDFTIADFVADVRAPTPSGAAQLAVPDRGGWLERLAQLLARFAAAMRRQFGDEHASLTGLRHRLQRAHPGVRLRQHQQRLDELEQRLQWALRGRLGNREALLQGLRHRLRQAHPGVRLKQHEQRLEALRQRLQFALQARLRAIEAHVAGAARALQAVSPLATLARGFAVITLADGTLVTDAGHVSPGDAIHARLTSGSLRAQVLERGT